MFDFDYEEDRAPVLSDIKPHTSVGDMWHDRAADEIYVFRGTTQGWRSIGKFKELMPFSAGDVVRLKSGGPKMTVEPVSPNMVGVRWMNSGVMHEKFLSPRNFEYAHRRLADGLTWLPDADPYDEAACQVGEKALESTREQLRGGSVPGEKPAYFVMSQSTKMAIFSHLLSRSSAFHPMPSAASNRLHSLPIDINDSMGYGEVDVFWTEVL